MDEQILKELKEGTEPEVFGEALAFLERKGVIRYEDFRKLKEWYRPLAFSVAGYTELEVLNQFLEELKRAIEEGTTKARFQENMDRFLEERGYDGLTPYHADRIFRQNMLTAYSVGHYQQMTDPDVMGRRRYWQYQTAGDGHVRESHAAMDGRVFPADSPVWDIWYPPNGFGCRDGGAGKAYGAYRGAGPAGYVQYGHRRDGGAAAGPEVPDEPGEGGVEAGPGCIPTGLKEAVPGTAEGA